MNRINVLAASTLIASAAFLAACGGGSASSASGGSDKKAACDAVYDSVHQLTNSSAITDWGNGKAATPDGGIQPIINDLKSVNVKDAGMRTKINAEIDALTQYQVVLEKPLAGETVDSVKAEEAIADAATDSAKDAVNAC
jgi:hypothetical protein